jgi:hypothetical protein
VDGAPEGTRDDAPALDADQLDRLDRALAAQLTSASGLALRASLLAGACALSILLLAIFSTDWLDDAKWSLSDPADVAMQVTLVAAVGALAVCLVGALVAVFPRRSWSDLQGDRTDALISGDREEEGRLGIEMVRRLSAVNARKSLALKIASWALSLAFLAIVVHGAVFVLGAEPVETRGGLPEPAQTAEQPGLPSADEQAALALRYAPRVWLHHDERFGPEDPDAFVAASRLRFLGRRGADTVAEREIDARRLGAACDAAPGGCHRSGGYLARELTRPYTVSAGRAAGLLRARGFFLDPASEVHRGELAPRLTSPMLYELRRAGDELLITYWFFYGYSRPYIGIGSDTSHNLLDVAHEGDWENVDVALSASGDHAPLRVLFYGHGHPASVPWDQVERVDDTHPVVYSALNSHASYPTAAPRRGEQTKVCGAVGCSHDFRDQGMRWDGWQPGRLQSARAQPWYGFGGAWGNAGDLPDTTGPLGPSRWKLAAPPEPGALVPVAR